MSLRHRSSDRSDRLSGRVVLITGGSRGIGLATAKAFLGRGARVAVCAKEPERLSRAEEELGALGEVHAVRADVTIPEEVGRLVTSTYRRFGPIDVLVNNAGRAWSGAFAGEAPESIDEIIDVNVKGVLYVARAVLPDMMARGQGVIINVSSGAGLTGFRGIATYSASKFAVVGFTEALAQEVRARGIRVYAICPGRVATDMQEEFSGRRIGAAPETIAQQILRLAGEHPPIRPGKCLTVYG